MATAKLSEYMGKLRNAKYLSPERLQKAIEEETLTEKGNLFAKVFPLPAYYGLVLDGGEYTVSLYKGRLEGADAKKKTAGLKTFRDFYILDTEAFEEFIDAEEAPVYMLRAPKGTSKVPTVGFMSEEFLESMSSEAAAQYAMELASKRLNKEKTPRTMSQATKDALQKARDAKAGKSKSPAPKGRK